MSESEKSHLVSPSKPSSSSPYRPRPSPSQKPFPRPFLCPITGCPMADPVIIPSGESFDRMSVQACKELNFTPPTLFASNIDFSSRSLYVIPNVALKAAILNWCHATGTEPPHPFSQEAARYFSQVRRGRTNQEPLSLSLKASRSGIPCLNILSRRSESSAAVTPPPPPPPQQVQPLPKAYLCPITGFVMSDPIAIPSGKSFDRISIDVCMEINLAHEALGGDEPSFLTLIPNQGLKCAIADWFNSAGVGPLTHVPKEVVLRVLLADNALGSPRKRYGGACRNTQERSAQHQQSSGISGIAPSGSAARASKRPSASAPSSPRGSAQKQPFA